MLSELPVEFTKDNLEKYIKEVAKEYRKQGGKHMPAEFILVGGASILINYGFRDMTTDIDAIIHAASTMKEVINRVGDHYGLPNGWMNADFTKTESYTDKLFEFSVFYKSYYNVLTIRTISSEYLIAMKLKSGRQYKKDLSDVLGILMEHEKLGIPIDIFLIRKAVTDLYEDWNSLPQVSRSFIEAVMSDGQYEKLYEQIKDSEKLNKEVLISFDQKYQGLSKESNVDIIIERHQKKAGKKSILAILQEKKAEIDNGEIGEEVHNKDDYER